MKIMISSAVNKELIFSRTPNYKNASFQWFRLLHNLRPDSRWQLGLLSRRPSRDKSGDRWETRRTSSQPQHRQDDQGSGENFVFIFPFLFLCLYFIHVYSASLSTPVFFCILFVLPFFLSFFFPHTVCKLF